MEPLPPLEPEIPGGASVGLYQYRFANVEFDESTQTLQIGGELVSVERLPLQLLAELLRRANEVVTRAELFETLWEGRPTVDHVLANAVNKLRRALGEEGAARLVNLPRVGYRLVGPVERVVVGRRPLRELDLAPGQPVPQREAFRLERRLAQAAERAVWLACEPRLQQWRVFKFATTAEALSQLKREYTVYRLLRHELGERRDIARVLGANFAVAPYFIECEHGGPDLPSWAANGDQLASLGPDHRLALFLDIARAVAAAHGVGVLHKDLKPANVLIGADAQGWVPRLTDFGSSRLLEPGRLAELGVTALGLSATRDASASGGTPLYLAPELLAGHSPTTRGDLFALGLILFQLMVGDFRRPMATGWEREIDDALLRADIAAATDGDPARRPGSVDEWIDRLARLPERHAAAARQAEAERAAEAARRAVTSARARRPWVAAAFAALMLGLGASLWFDGQARTALADSRLQARRLQTVNDFLHKDVLTSTDRSVLGPDRSPTLATVLEQASARAAQRFAGDPAGEAAVRMQLGDVRSHNAQFAGAEAEYRRAVALLAAPERPPAGAGGEAATLLLAARFGLALALAERGALDESTAVLDAAERQADAALLAGDSLLALRAVDARYVNRYARQKFDECEAAGQRRIALADRLAADDWGQRFRYRFKLADLYIRQSRFEPAEALLDEIARPPFTPERVGVVQAARGRVLWARARIAGGRLEGMENVLQAARATLREAGGPGELFVPLAEAELGNLYDTEGDLARSAELLGDAWRGFVAIVGDDHHATQTTALNLSINLIGAGRAREGLARIEAARPWFVAHLGGERGPVAQGIDFHRARALSMLGQHAAAARLLDGLDAQRLAEAEPGADWPWRLQAEKARAALGRGAGAEALGHLRAAVAEMETLKAPARVLAEYRAVLASAARR